MISLAGTIPFVSSRDVIGPMAKCAYDVALLLQIMAGPDAKDPISELIIDLLHILDYSTEGKMIAKRSPYKYGEVNYTKCLENATFKEKKLGFYPWKPESYATE